MMDRVNGWARLEDPHRVMMESCHRPLVHDACDSGGGAIDDVRSGQALERTAIRAHDRATGSGGRGRNHEVVSATTAPNSMEGDEQTRVMDGHPFVVRQHGDRASDLVDVVGGPDALIARFLGAGSGPLT